jgi:hypothetical protein
MRLALLQPIKFMPDRCTSNTQVHLKVKLEVSDIQGSCNMNCYYPYSGHYSCDSHVRVRYAAVNVTLYCHVRTTRALRRRRSTTTYAGPQADHWLTNLLLNTLPLRVLYPVPLQHASRVADPVAGFQLCLMWCAVAVAAPVIVAAAAVAPAACVVCAFRPPCRPYFTSFC